MTTTPFDKSGAATGLFIFARFIERMERLVDQPVDVNRARGFA